VAICMCHEYVEGLETERSPLRPRACGIVYLLTSYSTGRRLHLLNAVLKLYYSTGASMNICNDSVMHFRSFSRKRNINTLVTVTVVGGVGSVVERRSLAGGLSLSCARPAANG